MNDTLLTTLTIENYHPSTILSMDSSSSSHEDSDRDGNRRVMQSSPVDINLPIAEELGLEAQMWNDTCELLDVGLGPDVYEPETIVHVPKVGKKCARRADTIWGAWFFFSFYFKPVLKENSKCKVSRDCNGLCGFDRTDLKLDAFMVQHDMENIYMWVFKQKPDSALGKMQLRSYMNGHSRQGERPFPYGADKGFVRSHKMQRKHYRGLSNPQCVHGIELVRSPDFTGLDESEKKKWKEITGRDLNFSIPIDASDYVCWRNLPAMEVEVERPVLPAKGNGIHQAQRKLPNGNGLSLSANPLKSPNSNGEDLSSRCKRQRKEDNGFLQINSHVDGLVTPIDTPWANDFTGVMKNVYGPVTGAKTIYEDDKGFLIIISLPFSDLQRLKVTWRNTDSHGIVKIMCASIAGTPLLKRHGRTFKLADPSPEHCPQGDFVREISLPTRIPEEGKLEAYFDETGTVLEIMVPKQRAAPEEHEVRVCLRPSPWVERPFDLQEALV